MINVPHLIGKSPEEDRDHNTAPELSHNVEQAEAPYPHNGKWTKKPRPKHSKKLVRKSLRVNIAAERIKNKPKSPKESNERNNHRVEESLL